MGKVEKIVRFVLRALALAAMIVGIVVMVTSHDSANVLNLTFTAKYSNTPAFKYFVVAEAIAGGYTLLAIILSSKHLFWRVISILDVVATLLLTSSISAAVALAQVGKHGNSHAGWLPVCNQVPKFCDQVSISLVAGFVAAILYLVLVLTSLHSLLSPIFVVKPCMDTQIN